jgi:2-polyprenyl-3-methyl-5-hydroxy-6-metoxy-1,4-benzoquinol methylase
MKKAENSTMEKRESSKNLAVYQAKYHDSSLIVRYANTRFFNTINTLVDSISPNRILDLGCGEGMVLDQIGARYSILPVGIDIDADRVYLAMSQTSRFPYVIGSAQELPFKNNAFDMVMILEVLEHVGEPETALQEALRVTSKYLLASVPNEPWWRIGNMIRLKYLSEWGNTPEHINHWTVKGFKRFIQGRFHILRVETPVLWTFILAKKRH